MAGLDEDLYPFSDLGLARRLERAEAQSSLRSVEARVRLFPESGAQWIEVAGAYAMFDTASSPLTQTFGLGLFQELTSAEMDLIEEFFRERGAPVFHEVSPLAGLVPLALLNERGYRPVEFTSVMYRPIRTDLSLTASRNERIRVRLVREGERELWARIAARGWSEFAELSDFMLEIGQISTRAEGTLSFFAELDGQPIATGVLSLCEGVALLAGASTIPEGRKQGAQAALLESRLRYAAEQGNDIAMMCAQPGSASQRNAERHGFRIAYTRTKWRLAQSVA
jgi:GNAT superfamily N-acetyltransferase